MKCKNCHKVKGEHKSTTLACPTGSRTRIGHTTFSSTNFFELDLEIGLETEVNRIIDSIWRNLPLYPSTFGSCPTLGCKGSGRGSGKCLACLTEDLAKLTSLAKAKAYVKAVKAERKIRAKLYET